MEQDVAVTPRTVTFAVECRVPVEQAEAFAKAMTGNDDDIVLAAETAMRERVGRVYDVELEEVELGVPDEREVKRVLRETGEGRPPLA